MHCFWYIAFGGLAQFFQQGGQQVGGEFFAVFLIFFQHIEQLVQLVAGKFEAVHQHLLILLLCVPVGDAHLTGQVGAEHPVTVDIVEVVHKGKGVVLHNPFPFRLVEGNQCEKVNLLVDAGGLKGEIQVPKGEIVIAKPLFEIGTGVDGVSRLQPGVLMWVTSPASQKACSERTSIAGEAEMANSIR